MLTLLHNAFVCTGLPGGFHGDGAILIRGSKIVWVGDRADLPEQQGQVSTHDLGGRVVIPGLINTHAHGGLSTHRCSCDDGDLFQWASALAPHTSHLTVADNRRGLLSGCHGHGPQRHHHRLRLHALRCGRVCRCCHRDRHAFGERRVGELAGTAQGGPPELAAGSGRNRGSAGKAQGQRPCAVLSRRPFALQLHARPAAGGEARGRQARSAFRYSSRRKPAGKTR